ncbi:MAG: hypothetical protein ACK5M9_07540, partial [Mycobacterium sp.]
QVFVGELLKFPDWLSALSPFWHMPSSPLDAADARPLVVMLLVAVAALGLAMIGLGRRDLRAP